MTPRCPVLVIYSKGNKVRLVCSSQRRRNESKKKIFNETLFRIHLSLYLFANGGSLICEMLLVTFGLFFFVWPIRVCIVSSSLFPVYGSCFRFVHTEILDKHHMYLALNLHTAYGLRSYKSSKSIRFLHNLNGTFFEREAVQKCLMYLITF